MSEIILQGDENDINAALNESLQSAVVGSINVNGTRLDRILVVGTSDLDHNNDRSSVPVEEIEIQIPMEFDKYVSIDTTPISKVCRTCLCEKPSMHSLFETWEVETVGEMLMSFAAVQLSFGDGLPESVCAECMDLVGKCFTFKQLCERSESMLRCLVSQGHLQGMKDEPRAIHPNTTPEQKSHDENEPKIHVDKVEEPPDRHPEYSEGGFKNNHCSSTLALFKHSPDSSQPKNNRSPFPKRRLTVINNSSISINPDQSIRHHLKKRGNKQKKFLRKPNPSDRTESRTARRVRKVTQPLKYTQAVKVEDLDDFLDNCDNSSPEELKTETLDFQCCSCGKGFSNQRKLNRHERIHLDIKPFQCTICRKGFIESGDLRRHVRKHSKPSQPPDSMEQAQQPEGFRVPCSLCHLTFGCQGDLAIHSSVHESAPGRCVCRHCNKEFHTSMQLKRHVRTHLSDKPHKCRVCHKGFPEMGSLTRHFRRHTGETRERKHICSQCGKAYFDRHSLNIHERKHTGERPWICSECGKGFIDSRLLNSHMKIHSDLKPHACTMCDKRFKHESTLTTHIRTHTGEKPFICSVCGNAFVQSSNLSLHMRTHTREKPYHCDFCSKKFSSSSALTTHKRIHTGEKPYTCKICERRFARHDMTAHMRTHTGEKPFVCSVCSKGFTTPGQLQQHTRIHTGERPFICIICRKGCATSSYLKRHLIRSHKVTDISSLTDIPEPSAPELRKLLKNMPKDLPEDTKGSCEPILREDIKLESADVTLQESQAINVGSALSLSSNILNFVAVANTNGEVSIIRQQTANDVKMVTLTANAGGNIGTIITNTHMSQEKLFQIDPTLLRFTTGHLVPSQVTISELNSDSQ